MQLSRVCSGLYFVLRMQIVSTSESTVLFVEDNIGCCMVDYNSTEDFNSAILYRRGLGGGEWCGRSGHDSPRDGKMRRKINILEEKIVFSDTQMLNLLGQIRGNERNFLKFIISVRGGYCV